MGEQISSTKVSEDYWQGLVEVNVSASRVDSSFVCPSLGMSTYKDQTSALLHGTEQPHIAVEQGGIALANHTADL